MRVALLLPARARLAGAKTLAGWLARGDRLADAAPGREAALREYFEFPGAGVPGALPVAALTRSLEADDAGQGQWLRADPAWVMADGLTLRLLQCGKMDLSAEEAAQLGAALEPLFGEAGLHFVADRPERWYLRCPPETKLPGFSSPDDALGDDLALHLPQGDDARRWSGLLNEAQIVLTQHPLNARRFRQGLVPVNSLWFWGAGVLPARVRCRFAQIYTDDPTVVALAKLAGVRPLRCEPRAAPEGEWASGESVLIDLADRIDGLALDADWLAPLDAALRGKRIGRLELRFADGERFCVAPSHRWRFWRRADPRPESAANCKT